MFTKTVLAVVASVVMLEAQPESIRLAVGGGGVRAAEGDPTNVTAYIWADKYVYQPNERLTLSFTVSGSDETYPYTVLLFRQNNQTSKKTYLGGGKTSDTPIDLVGAGLADGFQKINVLPTARGILIGPGGLALTETLTIPNELGMHTFCLQLRDETGTIVLKSSYFKIGVVDEFVNISGIISADATWVNTKAYRINTLTRVENATLTIMPGTFVIGQPRTDDPTALIITTTARINAQGTRSRPIIMTSSQPFGLRGREDWGGLVLLGKARVNVTGGTTFIEGLDNRPYLVYGGTDDTHDCGALAYVRVEYAGSVFTVNNEINSFTWAGCGTKTVAHHLHAHYGKDDAFEWFGGTADLKYAVGSYGADDFLDYQLGWRGRVQYMVSIQHPGLGLGNRGIEGDNSSFGATDEPVSDPKIWNTTFIGPATASQDETTGDAAPGIYLRVGARGSINNTIVTNFGYPALTVNGAPSLTELGAGRLAVNGVLMWNNNRLQPAMPNTVAAQVAQNPAGTVVAQYAANVANNFVAADPLLRRPLVYSDPDFRPMTGSTALAARWNSPPDDGFFDQWASFCGAFGSGDDWMEEWTTFLRDEDIVK